MGDILSFKKKQNSKNLLPRDYDFYMRPEMWDQLDLPTALHITKALAKIDKHKIGICPITYQRYIVHERVRYDLDLLYDQMRKFT